MLKGKILEALKAKFTGVSDTILSRIAEKMAKTVTKEEDIATAVEGVTFQSVLEQYGDSRATEAQQTAVANYEKKHNLKEGKPVEQTPPPPTPPAGGDDKDKEMPAWAKTLMESTKALTDKVAAMEAGKTTATRRGELAEITKALPEALRKAYDRTSVESLSDDEFTALKESIKTEVEGTMSELQSNKALFGTPKHQQTTATGEATEAEAKAVLDRLNI